jgi:hypothetical protein
MVLEQVHSKALGQVPALGSIRVLAQVLDSKLAPEQVLALGSKPVLAQVLGSKLVLEQVLGSKLVLGQVLGSKLAPELGSKACSTLAYACSNRRKDQLELGLPRRRKWRPTPKVKGICSSKISKMSSN